MKKYKVHNWSPKYLTIVYLCILILLLFSFLTALKVLALFVSTLTIDGNDV